MKTIQGKNIKLRSAVLADTEFILSLRLLQHKARYLNSVEDDIEKQREWLSDYQKKEQAGLEYYFIIESKLNEKLGLMRVYDLQADFFCWRSWLIKDGAPSTTAIESVLMVYEFGFNELGYKQAHFDVRKGNERVVAFHQRLGAQVTYEDELNNYFNYKIEDYLKVKQKYKRYLK